MQTYDSLAYFDHCIAVIRPHGRTHDPVGRCDEDSRSMCAHGDL